MRIFFASLFLYVSQQMSAGTTGGDTFPAVDNGPLPRISQVTLDNDPASFFDPHAVRRIDITFDDMDFMQTLIANAPSETFMPCTVTFEDQTWESVGIRIKGNSSQRVPGNKKPFKLKFNEYLDDQRFFGVRKLALNNGFKDPSLLREAWAYTVLNQYIKCSRTTFVELHMNGQLWGFYTAVEVIDKGFLEHHFSQDDGNLFKCDGINANLLYAGPDPAVYQRDYYLKTNEQENDYSALIHLTQVLNQTPQDQLQDAILEVLDVESALVCLAFNVLTTNLDSYTGSGHNYYLYQDPETNRFIFIPWDLNEVFGVFTLGMNDSQLLNLPFDFQHDNTDRPLIQKLLSVPDFSERYREILFHMAKNHLVDFRYEPVIETFHQAIDASVAKCANEGYALYSYAQFQANLSQPISQQRLTIFGLNQFAQIRAPYILSAIGRNEPEFLVLINELMADNESGIEDELGNHVDWIELSNPSDSWVSLDGFFLSDDWDDPFKHELSHIDIPPHGFAVLLADSDPEEGDNHVDFKLDAEGESVLLTAPAAAGGFPVHEVVFPVQSADISYGRLEETPDPWYWLLDPTPAGENGDRTGTPPELVEVAVPPAIIEAYSSPRLEIVVNSLTPLIACTLELDWENGEESMNLIETDPSTYWVNFPEMDPGQSCSYHIECINQTGLRGRYPQDGSIPVRVPQLENGLVITEVMPSNASTLADSMGEFDDWIEVTNFSQQTINLGDYTISDDPDWPDRCPLPSVNLPPHFYILLWADGQPEQGATHLDFKLDADGESAVIFKMPSQPDAEPELITGLSFSDLPTDHVMARRGWHWIETDQATPGEDNRQASFME